DDHAAGGNRVRQQAIEHAARLEAAARLQVLELQPDFGVRNTQRRAGQFPQWRAADEMGMVALEPRGDARDLVAVHSFRPFGSGNFTVSSMPSILRTVTAPSERMRRTTALTSTSG